MFYRLVREFATTEPIWSNRRMQLETTPGERWDWSKLSRRAYGTPDETLTIMAAAGLNSPVEPLTERTIVLPTKQHLLALKKQAGMPTSRMASKR